MDFDFIVKSIPMYAKAAQFTLQLSFFGIILSLVIGLICSLIVYYKVRVLKPLVQLYIELSRNTPLLIQLFFLYYGFAKIGMKFEAYSCAVFGLAFLGGSYMAEAFRSGLEAVSKVQIESGLCIGLSRWQLMRYVILPQAFAVAVPAIGANAIFLIKETSIVSAIALADLMFVAKDLIGMYYKTTEALILLVGAYLILLLPLSLFLSFIERKVRHAGFGN
ncbi:amino acid ABC transporter permease [Anaerosinus massiliensis]|uniref:amino acid ABC transporter permease n=1 Tax=Massilibacillus massiliensis TaxID=1806837 RepID=UPI000A8A4DAE|nr:amino acid ABC transporter permease [Massilibacillus massiliensis]